MNITFDNNINLTSHIEPMENSQIQRLCESGAGTLPHDVTCYLGKALNSEWTPESLILECLTSEQLTKLREDPYTFFIFDFGVEGYEPELYFNAMYFNCNKYNINPNKIIYVTSHLTCDYEFEKFIAKHKYKQRINIFIFSHFKEFVSNIYSPELSKYKELSFEEKLLHNRQKTTEQLNKHFISLSRKNRTHRTIMQYYISNDPILSHVCSLSQDRLNDREIYRISNATTHPINKVKAWASKLPIIVDTNRFDVNYANYIDQNMYHRTLFELVGETRGNYPGLFYSEKTFRPMLMLQPNIILGQPNCNSHLAKMGFKLYTSWFDYSFDSEANELNRIKKIIKELRRVVTHINSMSTEEKINWKFKNLGVLRHNYNMLFDRRQEQSDLYHLFLSACKH